MPSRNLGVTIQAYKLSDHIDRLKAEPAKLPSSDSQVTVVDDGSSGATVDPLVSFEKEFDNFTLITCPEKSVSGVAGKIRFPHASGKYTVFFGETRLNNSFPGH